MSLKSFHLSDILFAFDADSLANFKNMHIRQVTPDYQFRTYRKTKNNELFKRLKIIYLNIIKNPWLALGFYFTPSKIEELDKEMKKYINKNESSEERNVRKILRDLLLRSKRNGNKDFLKELEKEKGIEKILKSKIFNKILHMQTIFHLKVNQNRTLEYISHLTGIKLTRVSYIWGLLKETQGNAIIKLFNTLERDKIINNLFPDRINNFMKDNTNKTKSMKNLFIDFMKESGDIPIKNKIHFCSLMKSNGFLYKPFVIKTDYSLRHQSNKVEFVKYLQFEFIKNSETFEIYWVDESTVCPQNFKKKGWGLKKKILAISSNLKYDKLKIFGLLSKTGIFALRFLQGSNSQAIFDDFMIECIKKIVREIDEYKIPVIFLDNSPLHKSENFLKFCKLNKVLLVFNIAYNPQGNPIEILWRYLKHPLKTIASSDT